MTWIVLALAGLAVATVGSVAFPALYLWLSNWRIHPVGRSTVAFSIVWAATLGLTLAGYFGLRLPAWAVAGLFWAMAVTVWWRVVVMWRTQHEQRTTRPEVRS